MTRRRSVDTLFLRLFMLMWVTLVASHAAAYFTVIAWLDAPGAHRPGRPGTFNLPTFPSLPPGNPFAAPSNDAARPGLSPGPPSGRLPGPPRGEPWPDPPDRLEGPPPHYDGEPVLPTHLLWLDYGVRLLVIALGGAIGARWLSAPMHKLSTAAASLETGFNRGAPPPQIDEHHGTVEVRNTARAFNHMAERLQRQHDARGMHMAAVSHDLRTPLARLRLRLEWLPQDVADKAAGDIREIDEMIDATLAVLREQQDGSAPGPLDVSALLQSMADDLAELGHDVSVDELPPLRVRAHPAALRRALGNVVGNALRYGGRARIGSRLERERVVVTVDDDGPGISEAQIERAFVPWVRLAPGDTAPNSRSGHGLGLAIARDLVERDGGTLTLSNRAEGGLRATLRLAQA